MAEQKRDFSHIPTSVISFVETEHGRLRRKQRGIDKKDLQAAKKHGERKESHPTRSGDPTAIYTHKDIVYITNERTGEEITSYTLPLQLDYVPIDDDMLKAHNMALRKIRHDRNSWLSNTVMVVDRSGSMNNGDVWGARTRLDAVWIAIALDYLAYRLETGESCPLDVISIVSLEQEATILIEEEPASWVLYNRIVRIYQEKTFPACGHGPFIPSLLVAEDLLTRNKSASCALVLSFLSDGKPSDCTMSRGETHESWIATIHETVADLAKKFGRRLTFAAIGIGNPDNFDLLKAMVATASDYGAIGIFRLPSMTSVSLGEAFTSVATSLTQTQLEMTDVSTMKQQQVRNVVRESRIKASQRIYKVDPHDFYIYQLHQVKRTIYEETIDDNGKRRKVFVEAPLHHPDAKYIAFCRKLFGEGGERFAYRLFELGADARTIVGKSWVAKESRFVLEEDAEESTRKKFVKTFCETQQLARRFAKEFNSKMAKMYRIDKATARVTFLDCSVYELVDRFRGSQSVLVEEHLDHNLWHKWNSNHGFVEGMAKAPRFSDEMLRDGMAKLADIDIHDINEGSEEEDDDDEEEFVNQCRGKAIQFTPSQVAQAFSHFSYIASGRKRLVCDLQGVYDETENLLKFSDPVIHYYDSHRGLRRCVHGRTDLGQKGFAMFFETHNANCGHLCKLMNGGLKHNHKKRKSLSQG